MGTVLNNLTTEAHSIQELEMYARVAGISFGDIRAIAPLSPPTHNYSKGLNKVKSERISFFPVTMDYLESLTPKCPTMLYPAPDAELQRTQRLRSGTWLLHERFIPQREIYRLRPTLLNQEDRAMIRDPEHIIPIEISRNLNDEDCYDRLERTVPFKGTAQRKRYELGEKVWFATGYLLHVQNTGQKPTIEEAINIAFENGSIFRPFWALNEEALGKRIEYPWEDEVLRKYELISSGDKQVYSDILH